MSLLNNIPSSIQNTYPSFNIIYLSLYDILFINNDILNDSVSKIKSDRIFFKVVDYNGIIIPLEHIIKMINNNEKINVKLINKNKTNNSLFELNINNFQFTKINNLFDFNYGNYDIMELDVSYTFENMEYINNNPIQIRKNKINKILKKPNLLYKLTKEQLGM